MTSWMQWHDRKVSRRRIPETSITASGHGLSVGNISRQNLFAQLGHKFGMFFQVDAGLVPALSQLDIAITHPGSAAADQIVCRGEVEHIPFQADSASSQHVKLGLP